MFLCLNSFVIFAQTPCTDTPPISCGYPDPESFVCIQGPVNVSTIIGSLLLPAAQAATTQQKILVKGLLTVDIPTASGGYSFTNGSIILFNDVESGIEVPSGCQLMLNASQLGSCNSMWKSVSVLTGGTLIAEQCTIRYGLDAIRINANANVSITNNLFEANYAAMTIGSDMPPKAPVFYTPGGGIWGNIIKRGNLIGSLLGKQSLVGIQIGNVTDLSIGSTSQLQNHISLLRNTFGSAATCGGIITVNSTIVIQNTKFQDIGVPSDNEDDAAAIVGVANSDVTLHGLGSSESTIQDGNCGLYLKNSTIRVFNAMLDNNRIGLVHKSDPNAPLGTLKINNCTIKGFHERAIWATGSIRFSAFEVSNCVLDDNKNQVGSRVYLTLDPSIPVDGTNFKFANNDFYYRARSAPGPLHVDGIAIIIQNINNGLAVGNHFYDEGTVEGEGPRGFKGVTMDGCVNFTWQGNSFIGNGGNPDVSSTSDQVALCAAESSFCKYNCNTLSGFDYGMQFYGGCNSSKLYRNYFDDFTGYGLELSQNNTVIGQQFKQYNIWNGKGAKMVFGNYDPDEAADQLQVAKSLFTVTTVVETTFYWANPRQVDDEDPDPNWFVGFNTPPTGYQCPPSALDPEEPKLDYSEMALVTGTFPPYGGQAADTWDASFWLFHRMYHDASLHPAGSPEASWYNTQYYGSVGQLGRIYIGIVNLSTANATTTAAQLSSDLSNFTAATIYEQNVATDFRTFLEKILSNAETFNSQQTAELSSIAAQCRLEGGVGVVFARLALGQPAAQNGSCNIVTFGNEDRKGGDSNGSNVGAKVFPNPTGNTLSIRLDRSIESGEMLLWDSRGNLQKTWTMSGDGFQVQDLDLPEGVYFIAVKEKGTVIWRQKVMIKG